ncbi:hypothetical protein [Kitasatospora camelliae]|uniref:Peptide zinc metalloprotease protein n=1 Tax=Kitasatospora camelliae TaxID=3156397 RepID=A0AAU8K8Q7_9ACTN
MSRVEFHPLGIREDKDAWIVGRADTGDHVAVPAHGVLAIRLLQQGLSTAEAARRIERETGRRTAVDAFVTSLAALGFVRRVDGRQVASPPPVRPTFPRLRPDHVRWALSPVLHGALLTVALAGAVAAAFDPHLRPHWQDLLWSGRGTAVLAGQAALTWVLLFLHELAHLLTARAAGVPGTVRFGTRLQFLVLQTDVSGVWQCDRRTRITVYLSGIVLDLALAGGCVLMTAAGGPRRLLAVVVLTKLVGVATELLVFMRTDVYFLLQDLLGCRNLYRDATAYARHLTRRLLTRSGPHPLTGLPPAERRAVRCYALLMVAGSAASLALGWLVLTRVTLVLLGRALGTLAAPPDLAAVADAVTTVVVLTGLQGLWVAAWWRRHGGGVRAGLRTVRSAVLARAARHRL